MRTLTFEDPTGTIRTGLPVAPPRPLTAAENLFIDIANKLIGNASTVIIIRLIEDYVTQGKTALEAA